MIPLTALTFLIWFMWRSRTESMIKRRIADEEVEAEELQKDIESGKSPGKKRKRACCC